jgi:hypothetical protein
MAAQLAASQEGLSSVRKYSGLGGSVYVEPRAVGVGGPEFQNWKF